MIKLTDIKRQESYSFDNSLKPLEAVDKLNGWFCKDPMYPYIEFYEYGGEFISAKFEWTLNVEGKEDLISSSTDFAFFTVIPQMLYSLHQCVETNEAVLLLGMMYWCSNIDFKYFKKITLSRNVYVMSISLT